MKRFRILLILLLSCNYHLLAQVVFPELRCETLADQTLTIPNSVRGKKTVVALAMSSKAEKELRAWNNPLYNALIAEGMGGLMGTRMYDAHLCFVGMLKGIAKLGLNETKKQAKREVEKKLYPHFMVSDDDVVALMKILNIDNYKEPHFFVLDTKGNIIYHTQGTFSDQKLNEITEKLLD